MDDVGGLMEADWLLRPAAILEGFGPLAEVELRYRPVTVLAREAQG